MRADADLRTRMAAVLGASTALGDDLAANLGEPEALAGTFDESDPFAGAATDSPAELRSAYRAALLRIAAADLTNPVDVEKAMARLSRLAVRHVGRGAAHRPVGARPPPAPRDHRHGEVRRAGAELRQRRRRHFRRGQRRRPRRWTGGRRPADADLWRRGVARRREPPAGGQLGGRWSARSPLTWPTTSDGPGPGSSRRC